MNSKRHICIVEDNAMVRESLQLLVEAWGYTATSFVSAEDFLSARSASENDCLILDYSLPGMNAQELMDKLDGESSRVPVIIVSGTIDDERQERLEKCGVVAVLAKPIAGVDLMQLIEHTFGK